MARILVIDDDENVQTLIRDVLSEAGHTVLLANDGREGLIRYRTESPDLVITDIFMPERDGLDVILELASCEATIIAMSGGGDLDRADHLDDALYFGARSSLAKPFTVDALLGVVNEVLTT
jgi:DNA-binding response OmpR family regulator